MYDLPGGGCLGVLVLKFIPGLDRAVSVPVWSDPEGAWTPVGLQSFGAFADPAVILQLNAPDLAPLPIGAASESEVAEVGNALAAVLGLADTAFLEDPPRPPAAPTGMRPLPGWAEVRGWRIEGVDGGLKPWVIVSCDVANRSFDHQANASDVRPIRQMVRLTNQPNVRPRDEFPELDAGGRAACAQVVTMRASRLVDRPEAAPPVLGPIDMRRIADGVMTALDFA